MNRHPHTIERIIHNKNILTFKQYLKLKELLEKQERGIKISDPYIEFISSDYHTFIKNLLNEFNVSRSELARQLKVGRTTTEKWIRKEAVISRSNYEKLINFIIKKRMHKQVNSLCFIHYILWFWVYIYQLSS